MKPASNHEAPEAKLKAQRAMVAVAADETVAIKAVANDRTGQRGSKTVPWMIA